MSTPAGWYPAPEADGRQRYFDGERWTDHYAPGPGQQPTATKATADGDPLARRRRTNKIILLSIAGVVGLFILLGIVGAIAGTDTDTTADAPATAVDTSSPTPSPTPSPDATSEAPSETPSTATPTSSPSPSSEAPPASPVAPSSSTPVEQPDSPTDVAADAIRDVEGSSVKLKGIYLNRDQPNSMTVRFAVGDNLSNGLIRTGIGLDTFAIAQGALNSGVPFRTLWVQGTFPTIDKFGEETPDTQIYQARFTRRILERINYDNIVVTQYDNIDDFAIGGTFFLLPDLRE